MIEALELKLENVGIWLGAVAVVFPLIISATVAYMSWSQLKINRLKLKLDLYERRFKVYQSALDYYLCFFEKSDDEQQARVVRNEFTAAYRESRFLFYESSGVYKYLTEIKDFISMPDCDTLKLERSIKSLEEAMMPMLSFRNIHG